MESHPPHGPNVYHLDFEKAKNVDMYIINVILDYEQRHTSHTGEDGEVWLVRQHIPSPNVGWPIIGRNPNDDTCGSYGAPPDVIVCRYNNHVISLPRLHPQNDELRKPLGGQCATR